MVFLTLSNGDMYKGHRIILIYRMIDGGCISFLFLG